MLSKIMENENEIHSKFLLSGWNPSMGGCAFVLSNAAIVMRVDIMDFFISIVGS